MELKSLKVKDIIVRDVFTVHRAEKLIDAAHTMIGAHVSCLVVLENYNPIGILTERDFIKKLKMAKDHSEELLVNDIMTKQLFTVDTHLDLFEAQKIMRSHNFRKLVIVENEELKGIITQTDLCRAVAELKSPYPPAPLVKDAMTKKVFVVGEDDKFLKAKKIMASKDIGSVLVADKKELRGIFTEFDIGSEFFLNPNRLRNSYMKELMTTPVICVTSDFDLFQINKIMLKHNFRRLAVVDEHKILGIITQTDVAKNLYEFIEKNKDYAPDKKAKHEDTDYAVRKLGSVIVYEKEQEKKENKQDQKKDKKQSDGDKKEDKEELKEEPKEDKKGK